MTNNSISPECQQMIDLIKSTISKAREMVMVSNQRALIAESQLTQHQKTQEQRIRDAYQSGQSSVTGTNEGNPEGGTKLVLNVN